MKTTVLTSALGVLMVLMLGALLMCFPPQAHSQGGLEPGGPPSPSMHSLEDLYQQGTQTLSNVSELTNVICQIAGLTNLQPQLVYFTNIVHQLAFLTNLADAVAVLTNVAVQLLPLTNMWDTLEDINARTAYLVDQGAFTTNEIRQLAYAMQGMAATMANMDARIVWITNRLEAVWAVVQENNAMLHAITNRLANP